MTPRGSEAGNLDGLSDERLMHLYTHNGSHEAFGILYARHAGRVNAYLSRRLGNRAEAEEVLQAIFLKFHKSRFQYDSRFEVGQWVFVICKSVLNDHFRKQGRAAELGRELLNEQAESVENGYRREGQIDAHTALQSLSEIEQQAVQWRYLDSLEYAEIASRLDKTEASIRQIVSRAIRKLRVLFASPGEES